jgi:hypothetical protein
MWDEQIQTTLRFSGFEDPFGGDEEESDECYKERCFCPVRIKDIYNQRYQVIPKLGFGSYSTVWLANDLRRTSHFP